MILTGYIVNGDTYFQAIFLKMFVLDKQGKVIATGYGNISDVKPHETTPFDAIARFSGNFSSCTIQIDNAIPK
ncbi:MAG: FxLYD domain-containing protein [Thaumarchaeota archaeon]|nr:FxLYD domain-containing protein [Nitrososphaerota archaeon]